MEERFKCLLNQEEKEDAIQCGIIDNFSTRDHEEDTT